MKTETIEPNPIKVCNQCDWLGMRGTYKMTCGITQKEITSKLYSNQVLYLTPDWCPGITI